MSVWLIVPMKSLLEGKSRLAPALDPTRRRALLERLLQHTLEQAEQFPGLERTLLVSACSEARARAAEFGAQVLEEHACIGLNGALRQAQLAIRRLGASHMLAVPCDLPLLEAEDLRRLAHAGSAHSVGIAPDRARQGTNGLCLDASLEFTFAFGRGSFPRHLEHVRHWSAPGTHRSLRSVEGRGDAARPLRRTQDAPPRSLLTNCAASAHPRSR